MKTGNCGHRIAWNNRTGICRHCRAKIVRWPRYTRPGKLKAYKSIKGLMVLQFDETLKREGLCRALCWIVINENHGDLPMRDCSDIITKAIETERKKRNVK